MTPIHAAPLVGRSPERVISIPFRGFRGLAHPLTLFIEFLGRLPTTVEVALRSASCHRADDHDCVEACKRDFGRR
jgi:hypothetical protein